MLTTRPRGTSDILPLEAEKWHWLEQEIRKLCIDYGYGEIRTPIFEHTELFYRGVGETTDIVEKEMYTFEDRGGRSITLRPEGTAATVRAYLENKLYAQAQPIKLYYVGPMFRYDRPQAGRLRQFHQFGIEVFGSKDPMVDTEVIDLAMEFYRRLGLKGLELHLNSIGCKKCRPVHGEKLTKYLEPHLAELCPTCQGRFYRNPLRILDCKSSACKELLREAPAIIDCLCPECAEHFAQVCANLEKIGIPYILTPHLVRGLDYYTNTAFEILAEDIGAQSTVCGGGRYDMLIEECGGQPTPGIGFALGLERTLLSLEAQKIKHRENAARRVFVASVGDSAKKEAFRLVTEWRRHGVPAELDYMGRSLKAQLKYADKWGAAYVVILGQEELDKRKVIIRDMKAGQQEEIQMEAVQDYLRKVLQTSDFR